MISSEHVYKPLAHFRVHDGVEQSVGEHLRGVAAYADKYAAKIGLGECGRLLGLVHDLGKYSSEFQAYIRSGVGLLNPDEDDYVDAASMKGRVDHSTAGAQVVWQALSKKGPEATLIGQILALCVASHHSGLIDCKSPDGIDNFSRRMQKPEERVHLSEAVSAMDDSIRMEIENLLNGSEILTQATTVIGALLSNGIPKSGRNPLRNNIPAFKLGMLVRILFSCLIDADRIDTADFEDARLVRLRQNSVYVSWEVLEQRLLRRMGEFRCDSHVDLLRREVAALCGERGRGDRGIYTLTVPTGGGKTLASLKFAIAHAKKHDLERIVFVVPFTSIIDQNAQVVRDILEIDEPQSSIVLEHHSNLTPNEQTWRGKILAENWDAPIIYTTSVQLLETLFAGGTRGARRLHQLARAVLVFDEIQTLPIRCVHMFCNALNFLVENCGTTAVLCTATQPLLGDLRDENLGRLQIMPEREIVKDIDRLFTQLRRVELVDATRANGWTDHEVAELVLEQVANFGSSLVIVNTKAAAERIYQVCKARNVAATYHLSTAMCPEHRMRTLADIREKLANGPTICISTQLIEAGVDIDFGGVIRFLAGMDSIAQAAGRCNRNGRRTIGQTYIVNPQSENIKGLRDIVRGQECTKRLLAEFRANPSELDNDLLSPAAMRRFFSYYFYDRADEMTYKIAKEDKEIGRDDTLLELLSSNLLSPGEMSFQPALRHAFGSAGRVFAALDAPTHGIIVPYQTRGKEIIAALAAAHDISTSFELLRAAQRYSVNVFPHIFKRMSESGAIKELQAEAGIYYLDERYYSDEYGLTEMVANRLNAQII